MPNNSSVFPYPKAFSGLLANRPVASAEYVGATYLVTDALGGVIYLCTDNGSGGFTWNVYEPNRFAFGLLAARPAASASNASSVFYATDAQLLSVSVQTAAGVFTWVTLLSSAPGPSSLTAPVSIVGTVDTEQVQVITPFGATSDIQTWRRKKNDGTNNVVADITATGAIEANAISFQNGLDTPGGGGIVAELAGGALVLTCGPQGTGNVVAQPFAGGGFYIQFGAVTANQILFDASGMTLKNAKDLKWFDTGNTARTIMRLDGANTVDFVSAGVGFTWRTNGFAAISMQLYETGEIDINRGPIRGQVGVKHALTLAANGTTRIIINDDGIGLNGNAAVVPGARPGQIADNSTGAVSNAVADVGAAFSQVGLNNIHATILDRVNKIEAFLKLRGDIT